MPEVEQMHEMSLEPINWMPLERRIGRQCAEFMWMCRKDGVEFYKHVETRRYLLLDSESRCYRQAGGGVFVEADFEQELRLARGIESRPALERQLAEELDRKTEEMAAMNGTEQTLAIRTWICEASAERVGQTWREEDHAALVRNMRAADRLTVQLVDFASERAVKTALQTVQREDFHGSRSEVEHSRAGLALRGD
jgi:hypothetical protein